MGYVVNYAVSGIVQENPSAAAVSGGANDVRVDGEFDGGIGVAQAGGDHVDRDAVEEKRRRFLPPSARQPRQASAAGDCGASGRTGTDRRVHAELAGDHARHGMLPGCRDSPTRKRSTMPP